MKTRIKKNYVVFWTGPRGGNRLKKFFTKPGVEKFKDELKATGFKDAKVRVQTKFKVTVVK